MISVNVIAVFWVLLLNICLFFQKRIKCCAHGLTDPGWTPLRRNLTRAQRVPKVFALILAYDAGCHSDALSPQTLLLMSWLAAHIQTKGHTSECPERARPPAFTIHGLGSLWLSWSLCLCSTGLSQRLGQTHSPDSHTEAHVFRLRGVSASSSSPQPG